MAISSKTHNQDKIIFDINNNIIGKPSVLVEQFFILIVTIIRPKSSLKWKGKENILEVLFHNINTWYNKVLTMEELETASNTCTVLGWNLTNSTI